MTVDEPRPVEELSPEELCRLVYERVMAGERVFAWGLPSWVEVDE